jgi:putative Mg2+ transporter-C (MgtC) family protein
MMPEVFTLMLSDILRLLAAFAFGALVGAEREFHDKAAGLRTIILISVGAALFTIFSVKIAGDNDPGRIAAQIVTGVGFLGAGVILHRQGQVRGLTTAATIWVAAALGVGAGLGYLVFTFVATILIVLVLWAMPVVETVLERGRLYRGYRITWLANGAGHLDVERIFRAAGLWVRLERRAKRGDQLVTVWWVVGRPASHEQAIDALLAHPEIHELDY